MGRYNEAIEHHLAALQISRRIGDARCIASDLGNLGLTHLGLGNHEEAIKRFLEAREIFSSLRLGHLVKTTDDNISAARSMTVEADSC